MRRQKKMREEFLFFICPICGAEVCFSDPYYEFNQECICEDCAWDYMEDQRKGAWGPVNNE